MLLETHSSVGSTPSDFVPNFLPPMDPSSGSNYVIRWLDYGKESLATSSDIVSLQRATVELAYDLYLKRLSADATDTLWNAELFPMLVDEVCFAQVKPQQGEDQARERLSSALWAAFESEPLEDGMYHPAEQVIRDALQSTESELALEWLRELSLDAEHQTFSAEVLRCLARQEYPGSALWRTELVRDGLGMESAEIRDAAVQAAEWWGDRDLRDVLESHHEPIHWLRDYIREVIEDFGE